MWQDKFFEQRSNVKILLLLKTVKGRRKMAMNQSTGNQDEPLLSDGYVIL